MLPTVDVIDEAVDHRIGSAWVGGICKGGVHVVSVYLTDSQGVSEANQTLLAKLTQLVSGFRRPWVIGVTGIWRLQSSPPLASWM